jgi:hypothetical protein
MDNEATIDFDWNEQSLFSTPIGKIVQLHTTAMLLDKQEKTSEYALYLKRSNDVIFNLSQSFWDIDLTIKLIHFADPKIKSFKMTRVDRGDYIKYHMENYFFRLPKLKDLVLQLLNVIYNMGLTQSKGLEKKVRAHQKVQDNKLYIYLDYFEEALAKIRPLRDTIAHRGDLEDANLAVLSTYQLSPFDRREYESRVRMAMSYTYIFEKNQGILKQAVIVILLALEADFNIILNSCSRLSHVS